MIILIFNKEELVLSKNLFYILFNYFASHFFPLALQTSIKNSSRLEASVEGFSISHTKILKLGCSQSHMLALSFFHHQSCTSGAYPCTIIPSGRQNLIKNFYLSVNPFYCPSVVTIYNLSHWSWGQLKQRYPSVNDSIGWRQRSTPLWSFVICQE